MATGLLLAMLVAGCARAAPQNASSTPTATRLDETTYELDALPSQLLLADRVVYFTAADGSNGAGQRIYRLDLETAEVREVAASSYYAGGALDSYRLMLAGDWLIYLEVSPGDNGRSWTLAGTHLATGEMAVIDQAADDQIGWPGPEVAADGDWVIWTRKEAIKGTVRSRVHAYNARSGERKVLGKPLDAMQEAWGWPDLHGELLVLERDGTDPASPTASVEMIDLRTGDRSRLSGPGPASEPSTDGRYVAWKAGLRYDKGELVIYDLETREAQTVGLQAEYPQMDAGQVIAWAEGTGLVRVEAASGRYEPLAQVESDYPPTASINGQRVAWLELDTSGQARARLRLAG